MVFLQTVAIVVGAVCCLPLGVGGVGEGDLCVALELWARRLDLLEIVAL